MGMRWLHYHGWWIHKRSMERAIHNTLWCSLPHTVTTLECVRILNKLFVSYNKIHVHTHLSLTGPDPAPLKSIAKFSSPEMVQDPKLIVKGFPSTKTLHFISRVLPVLEVQKRSHPLQPRNVWCGGWGHYKAVSSLPEEQRTRLHLLSLLGIIAAKPWARDFYSYFPQRERWWMLHFKWINTIWYQ